MGSIMWEVVGGLGGVGGLSPARSITGCAPTQMYVIVGSLAIWT